MEDLYSDLPEFNLGDTMNKVEEQNKLLQKQIVLFEKEITNMKHKVVEMKKTQATLENNISELFKTAKAEIERKDRIIAELRREKDDILFKRQGFKRGRENSPSSSLPQVQDCEKRAKYNPINKESKDFECNKQYGSRGKQNRTYSDRGETSKYSFNRNERNFDEKRLRDQSERAEHPRNVFCKEPLKTYSKLSTPRSTPYTNRKLSIELTEKQNETISKSEDRGSLKTETDNRKLSIENKNVDEGSLDLFALKKNIKDELKEIDRVSAVISNDQIQQNDLATVTSLKVTRNVNKQSVVKKKSNNFLETELKNDFIHLTKEDETKLAASGSTDSLLIEAASTSVGIMNKKEKAVANPEVTTDISNLKHCITNTKMFKKDGNARHRKAKANEKSKQSINENIDVATELKSKEQKIKNTTEGKLNSETKEVGKKSPKKTSPQKRQGKVKSEATLQSSNNPHKENKLLIKSEPKFNCSSPSYSNMEEAEAAKETMVEVATESQLGPEHEFPKKKLKSPVKEPKPHTGAVDNCVRVLRSSRNKQVDLPTSDATAPHIEKLKGKISPKVDNISEHSDSITFNLSSPTTISSSNNEGSSSEEQKCELKGIEVMDSSTPISADITAMLMDDLNTSSSLEAKSAQDVTVVEKSLDQTIPNWSISQDSVSSIGSGCSSTKKRKRLVMLTMLD